MEEEIFKVYKTKTWTSVVFGMTTVERTVIYEVSNYGRVKKNGKIVNFKDRRYYKVADFNVHRAVAELFVPNPNNYNEVDHIDGNTHNNRADNLRWCTHKENVNNPVTIERNRQSQLGKHLSDNAKKLLSEKFSGENNPMYGKNCEDYMTPEAIAQKRQHMKEAQARLVWIHLGNKTKHVDIDYLDYWLDDGWVYGRKTRL